MNRMRLHFFTIGTAILLTLIWGVISQMESSLALALIQENGPIETATAAFFFIGSLLIFTGPEIARRWPAAAILLIFGLRELDFHSRFTTMNLTKSRFYLSPDVPFAEKLFGLCVLLFFLVCIYLLIKHYGKTFLRQLRLLDGLSVTLATSFLFLVVAKSIDGLPRKLKPLGITMDDTARLLATAGEELLELGGSILMLTCAIVARKLGRSRIKQP